VSDCPSDPEEIAEQYVMGHLEATQRLAFTAHLLTCEACARLVEEADLFVRTIRKVLPHLDDNHTCG